MKKFIIISSKDYAHYIFEGESLEDPKMREEMMEWLCHIKEWEEITDSKGIKAYEIIERPTLIPNIWKVLKIYRDKTLEKWQKNMAKQFKLHEQRQK